MSYFNMCGPYKRSFQKVGAAKASYLKTELDVGAGPALTLTLTLILMLIRGSCSLPSAPPSIG